MNMEVVTKNQNQNESQTDSFDMIRSYERTIKTIQSEITSLEVQLKPLLDQKWQLAKYKKQLVDQLEEFKKENFKKTKGVTVCPKTNTKNSKNNKNSKKSKKTQSFDQLKDTVAKMSKEEQQQLLEQFSSSEKSNEKNNQTDDQLTIKRQ